MSLNEDNNNTLQVTIDPLQTENASMNQTTTDNITLSDLPTDTNSRIKEANTNSPKILQFFKNKSKKFYIILSSIVAVLIACTCVCLFVPTVNNFLALKFLSEKSYLAKVEAKDINKKTDALSDSLKKLDFKETSKKSELNIKISNQVKSFLPMLLNQTDSTTNEENIDLDNTKIDDKDLENIKIDDKDLENIKIDDKDLENIKIDDKDLENIKTDDKDFENQADTDKKQNQTDTDKKQNLADTDKKQNLADTDKKQNNNDDNKSFDLGIDTNDLLKTLLPYVDSITINKDYTISKEKFSGTGKLILNNSEILDATYYLDFTNNAFYIQIPTLSNKWLKFTLTKNNEKSHISISNLIKAFNQDSLPTLLNNYGKIFFNNLTSVSKTENYKLEKHNISTKCTLLKASITDKDLKNILTECLNESKNNKDMKNFFIESKIFENEQIFIEYIDNNIKEIEEAYNTNLEQPYESTTELITWVDNKGNVIGNELSLSDEVVSSYFMDGDNAKENNKSLKKDNDTKSITTYGAISKIDKDKENYAYYITTNDSGNNPENILCFSGEQTNSKSGKIGKASLSMKPSIEENADEDEDAPDTNLPIDLNSTINIEYDSLCLNDNGVITGKIYASSSESILGNLSVDMELEENNGYSNITCNAVFSSIPICNITRNVSQGDDASSNIKIPEKSIEIAPNSKNLPKEYSDTIDNTKLKDNLKKAINNDKMNTKIDVLFQK